MTFAHQLPAAAAWRHRDAREGFEAMFPSVHDGGYRLEGHTAAVEDGQPWTVRYEILLDEQWRTRTAHVSGRSLTGERKVKLEWEEPGRWRIDGAPAPQLDGCIDVDLESSACTNTIPVHRLRLRPGQSADAPAAYVRAVDLSVQRLEQQYSRVDDDGGRLLFDYHAPAFDFTCRLVYDQAGLVLDYPGIAARVL